MATTTPNYAWPVPTSTDYVKDGAVAIEALGDAIDATVFGLPSAGLTLISTTTIGTAVASVTVSGAFSATYDNYQIVVSDGVVSAATNLKLTLGATATGYYGGLASIIFSTGALNTTSDNNATSFSSISRPTTNTLNASFELNSPFLAKNTMINSNYNSAITSGDAGFYAGFLNNSTSYTAFTLATTAGTFTGGKIRVYGFKN